jgi:hypothetical protein
MMMMIIIIIISGRRWARIKDAWTIFIELRQRLVDNVQSYQWLKFEDIREEQHNIGNSRPSSE